MSYNTTKTQALAAAQKLCARLGEGYEPVVHENLGWHYKAKKGYITVREYIVPNPEQDGYPATYEAWIEPGVGVGFSGGHMSLGVQIRASGETPKEAVAKVLKERDVNCVELESIVAILRGVE